MSERFTVRLKLQNGWTISIAEDKPRGYSVVGWPTSDEHTAGVDKQKWFTFKDGSQEYRGWDSRELIGALREVNEAVPPEETA